jgi:hypothetical protein
MTTDLIYLALGIALGTIAYRLTKDLWCRYTRKAK